MTTTTPHSLEGAVIVRVSAPSKSWVTCLPAVPTGQTLTVSAGRVDLLPVDNAELARRGYRIVGVAADHRPIGAAVDVLIPAQLRDEFPDWFEEFAGLAERVFDLRLGPVQMVLAAEIELHLRALDG